MNSLQRSDWSTNVPYTTKKQPTVISVNAWEESNHQEKMKNETTLPWSRYLMGFAIGALLCGMALAVILTIWLKTGAIRTTTTAAGFTEIITYSTTSVSTTTSTTSTTSTSVTTSTTSSTTTSTTSTTTTSKTTSTTSTSVTTTTTSTSTTSTTSTTTTVTTSTTTSTTSTSTTTTTTSTSVTTTTTSTMTTTTPFSTGWNATGITIAGVTGSSGVGANQFNHPYNVIVDSSKSIYVTDQPNHRVQKWVAGASSGSTVAGQSNGVSGSALNQLSYPSGLTIDSSGNLYIVDGGNNRAVLWPNGSSSGTLVAGVGGGGTGNNQFQTAISIARDSSTGTLYIADADNNRVMQYLSGASSGTVVAGGNGAGTASNQLNFPRGLCFDSSSNSLLIVNRLAHNVVRWVIGASSWTLVTGSSTGATGTTSTLLNYPTGVTLDSLGNIYVADEFNHRIQFYLPGQSNGSTIAGVTATSGNTAQLFCNPTSVAIDNQFNIYVTDYNNYRIQQFLHY